MTKLENLNKAELIEMVEKLEKENVALKNSRKRGSGRKLELLEDFAVNGGGKIIDIAARLGISTKNVSSLICYLRKDGWGIIVNEDGDRVITKFKGKDTDAKAIKEYVSKERVLMEEKEKEGDEE